MRRKWFTITLSLLLLVPMIAACAQKQGGSQNQEQVLRIAIGSYFDEQSFRQQFTELFQFAHQNITLEIVPTMDEGRYWGGPMQEGTERPKEPFEILMEMMNGDNPPDVVMFDYNQLPTLVNENLLLQLDPLITKDKFDVDGIVPTVIDGIKSIGDGKLYALAPFFYSSAMIYNKGIFDTVGIDYPHDNMTWDEVFDLALRLTQPEGDNPRYGFSFNTSYPNLYYGMEQYSAPLQLRTFNDDLTKLTVNTDQWERVWSTIFRLKEQNIVPPMPDYSRPRPMAEDQPFSYDDFLSGRLAMSLIDYGQLDQIINVNKYADRYPGYTPISWDVVTVPSHPDKPNVGGNIYMNGVMGINTRAQNPDAAWEFIKFINSDEWAKLKSSGSYQMVSRKEHIKAPDGLDFNIEAFFKNIPSPMDTRNIYREVPGIYTVLNIGNEVFEKVVSGDMSVKEALEEWQTRGDTQLQEIRDNPDSYQDMYW